MADQKPISFEDMMAASEPPASSPFAAPDLTPVRYFTADGLDEVAKLLKTIRTDKTLHRDEVEDLLDDPQYAKPLDPEGDLFQHAIDRTRVFATKLELCEYFTSIFDDVFLETNRKNAGLWTWLALAYYPQFVKTKGSIVELTADARWIYDAEIYRLARRHFIIGILSLYLDFGGRDAEIDDLLFSGPVFEWSRMVDVLTYIPASMRCLSFMKGVALLYYDATKRGRVKRKTFDKQTPGNVWEFQRVFQQLKETWDFSDLGNAQLLLEKLPGQFQYFMQW